MSTVAATLSASIHSEGSYDSHDSCDGHSLYSRICRVSVIPDAVGFCIGKHRANLRRIGNRIREDSGFSVFIKYVNTGGDTGYFEISSEDRLAREQAKTALLDSENHFQKYIMKSRM